jgi:hypothetical protein
LPEAAIKEKTKNAAKIKLMPKIGLLLLFRTAPTQFYFLSSSKFQLMDYYFRPISIDESLVHYVTINNQCIFLSIGCSQCCRGRQKRSEKFDYIKTFNLLKN